MTDWGSAYNSGGSSGGGTDWGSFYGGGSHSTGGGKPLSSGGGGGGGILGLAENLAGDVGSTITNLPRGVVGLAHQAAHTFGPSGVTENIFAKNPTGIRWLDEILNAGRNPHARNASQDKASLIGGTAVPFIASERHLYGSALHGNFHPLYQHPLQPILDIATLASAGGVGAAKLAEAGKLGEGAANIAKAERVLKTSKLEEPLNTARTLQGRYLQQKFDRLSMQPEGEGFRIHENTPIIGANPRLAKIGEIRKFRQTVRASLPAREFDQITKGLSKDEKFAFHVGAEGVPLHERVDFYRKEFRDNPTPQLRDYLHRLESDGVHEALTNPSDRLVKALHEGAGLQEKATQRLVDAGELAPETHASRTLLPQEVMARPDSIVSANLSRVHEDFPAAFRFPHIGEEAEKPGLFTSPSNASALRPPKTPGFLRRSEAVRLRTARLMTDPSVLSRDYLATMRYEHLNELYHKVLRPASKPIDESLARTGFKAPGEHYIWEKTSHRAPRSATQQEAMSRDLGMIDAKGHETDLGANARERVFSSAKDAPPELRKALEDKNFAKLEEMGVRRVPAAFAKRYNANFASTGKWMRLFWDRPLDVWRAMTLNYRPAWMVNNLVGNAAQYALRYAGPEGAANYLRALLATERGPDKFIQIRNYTRSVPTLQRKYGRIFKELWPEVHGTGFYATHSRMTKGGVYQSTLDSAAATRAGRALSLPAKVVKGAVTAIPRGITAFEKAIAEAVPREAAMLNELSPIIKKLGLAHLPMEDALRAIAHHDTANATHYAELAMDRMLDYMGDFNALNATERRVIKRVIPFESWYRVITQVSAKFALHYPARINLLRAIGQAYTADNQNLPSWLKGAIPVGPEKGGVQPMLTTMGLNPYETIPQLAEQNPAGILAFPLQAAATGVTGVDPFTQGTYRGIGAGKGYSPIDVGRRALGSAIEAQMPFQLYGKVVGTPPSYLYQPKTYGHVGPVAINDALLQYLGLPIRHVKKGVAKTYAKEGR